MKVKHLVISFLIIFPIVGLTLDWIDPSGPTFLGILTMLTAVFAFIFLIYLCIEFWNEEIMEIFRR